MVTSLPQARVHVLVFECAGACIHILPTYLPHLLDHKRYHYQAIFRRSGFNILFQVIINPLNLVLRPLASYFLGKWQLKFVFMLNVLIQAPGFPLHAKLTSK